MKIEKRVFVSFDGFCKYNCKHCFSFEQEQCHKLRSLDEITDSLKSKEFDVVYVSQKRENFINQDEGLALCEMLFSKYKCNIVIITRSVFDIKQRKRLIQLNSIMKKENKYLFLGVSVVGLESSICTEDLTVVPAPIDRIDFLKDMYNSDITTMLLIRPLFPERVIPLSELKKIIDYTDGKTSCILTGALMVNEAILKRLRFTGTEFQYIVGGESEYLDGAHSGSMNFVDVRKEIDWLKEYCSCKNIKFFEHSLPAINYLIGEH